MTFEQFSKKYLESKRKPLAGLIPYPSFNFLMGLALPLCLAWFYYVPGSMPLA